MGKFLGAILLCCLCVAMVSADVQLAPIFSDGMVLQHDVGIPIWGKENPGTVVKVMFAGNTYPTTTGADGTWRITLPPQQPGGPHLLLVQGRDIIAVNDVYVGDVWVYLGQAATVLNADEKPLPAMVHVSGGAGPWCAPWRGSNLCPSAVQFARALAHQQEYPIGLIHLPAAGATLDAWMPAAENAQAGTRFAQYLQPLLSYAIKGIVWEEGSEDATHAQEYPIRFAALVQAWRTAWASPTLPVLTTLLPGSTGAPNTTFSPGDPWALLREAQLRVAPLPRTGLVGCSDLPISAMRIGDRLALAARNVAYGERVVYQCPVLRKVERKAGQLFISFAAAGQGIEAREATDGMIRDLYLVDAAGQSSPATAKLVGATLQIDLNDASATPEVYYAWGNRPNGNLYSKDGLPVQPFRITSLRWAVKSCAGRSLELTSNQPLDAETAVKPAAYATSVGKVAKAELLDNGMGVRLTMDRPWKTGMPITVRFPGFTATGRQQLVQDMTFSLLPGRTVTGDLLQEFTVGGLRRGIDPVAVITAEQPSELVRQPMPAKGWTLAQSADGRFDLAQLLGQQTNALAAAQVYLYAESKRTVQFWLGSDDGVRVTVNGDVIYRNPVIRRMEPDQDKIPQVQLRQGWNRVLLEVAQQDGGWKYCLRVMDEQGNPPISLSYQAQPPAATTAR